MKGKISHECRVIFAACKSALKSREKLKILNNQVLSHFIIMGLGLMTSALWARSVSLELFGYARLATSISDIVGVFCLSGLSESAAISSARGYHGNFSLLIRYKFAAGIVGGLAVLGVGCHYFFHGSQETGLAIFILAGLLPFSRLIDVWSGWMFGAGKLNSILVQQVLNSLLALAGSLVVIGLSLGKNPTAVFLGMFLPGSICTLIFLGFFYRGSFRANRTVDRGVIAYGVKTSGGSILGSVLMSDRILVERYLGVEAVAIYSVATVFSNHAKTAFRMLSRILIPSLYSFRTIQEAWAYLRPKITMIFSASVALALLGGAAIYFFIPILYSEKYVQAAHLGAFLWAIIWLSFAPTLLGVSIMAQRNVLLTNIVGLVYPSISIGVLWLLLIVLDSTAAMYGRGIFDLLFFSILYLAFFCHLYRKPIAKVEESLDSSR